MPCSENRIPNSYGRTDYYDDVPLDSYGQPAAPLDYSFYPPRLEAGFKSKKSWEDSFAESMDIDEQGDELRMDFDGIYYSKEEFYTHYGGYREWDDCHPQLWRRRHMIWFLITQTDDQSIQQTLVKELLKL